MEVLSKILGSVARVRIMRLFLLNKSDDFTNKDIVKRSRVTPSVARRELKLLSSIGFIKNRTTGWSFNPLFKYGTEFENLLLNADTLDQQAILSNFKKAGQIKLLVISGVFIKNKDTRVDLLIVGNKIKKGKVEEGIRKIEAELGVELVYAVFDTKEFIYRLNMYDKLVRDIFDYPHEVVLKSKELPSTFTFKKA